FYLVVSTIRRPTCSTLFPYTTLFRSLALFLGSAALSLITIFCYGNRKLQFVLNRVNIILNFILLGLFVYQSLNLSGEADVSEKGDRKSTRLNSSHVKISYAVFCLKKK